MLHIQRIHVGDEFSKGITVKFIRNWCEMAIFMQMCVCVCVSLSWEIRLLPTAPYNVISPVRWSNFQTHDFLHSLERVFSMTFSSAVVPCYPSVCLISFYFVQTMVMLSFGVDLEYARCCAVNSLPNEDTINQKVNRLAYGKLLFSFLCRWMWLLPIKWWNAVISEVSIWGALEMCSSECVYICTMSAPVIFHFLT